MILCHKLYKEVILRRRFVIYAILFSALLFVSLSHGAYDDGARYMFTASAQNRSIYIIDLHKRKHADTILIDFEPNMISASDSLKALVVASRDARRLILVDLSSDQLSQYSYPISISPDYINVSPIGDTIAIYDRDQQILEVHALKRRQVLLRADNVRSGDSFTFNLDGSTIYWVDHEAGTLNSVDLWSKRKKLKLTSTKEGLSSLSRSIDGLLGFVSSRLENAVYVINLRDFTSLIKIRVGSNPGRPWGTTDGSYMLVPNQGDSTVSVISASSLQSIYTVSTVNSPISINSGWLDTTAAVLGAHGAIGFIDVIKGTAGKEYDLKNVPHEGIVTSDSKTLLIPVAGKGAISFFDMRTRSLTSEISGLPKDIGAATLAVSNNLCH